MYFNTFAWLLTLTYIIIFISPVFLLTASNIYPLLSWIHTPMGFPGGRSESCVVTKVLELNDTRPRVFELPSLT